MEANTLKVVNLGQEFLGKKLQPQTLSNIVWRHFLHPEAKSLGPDGEECGAYTHGLLRRRPILATKPFKFIGKEMERRAQEGEDVSTLDAIGPIAYEPGRTINTHAADASLIMRASQFRVRQLHSESAVSQHAVERFLRGGRVHPSTRARLSKAVEKLERAKKLKGRSE